MDLELYELSAEDGDIYNNTYSNCARRQRQTHVQRAQSRKSASRHDHEAKAAPSRTIYAWENDKR